MLQFKLQTRIIRFERDREEKGTGVEDRAEIYASGSERTWRFVIMRPVHDLFHEPISGILLKFNPVRALNNLDDLAKRKDS
jgi:hypothetical protein